MRFASLFIASFLFLIVNLTYAAFPPKAEAYLQVLKDVRNLHTTGHVAHVRAFHLQRDAAGFDFDSGTFYRLNDLGGKQLALLFEGQGHFQFTPPNKIEREHLQRFLDKSEFSLDFNTLVFLCNDSTLEKIEQQFPFTEATKSAKKRSVLKEVVSYYLNKDQTTLRTVFMESILDVQPDGLFHAVFYNDQDEPFAFEILPASNEPVRFLRKAETSRLVNRLETVSQFESANKSNAPQFWFHVTHYNIDTKIAQPSFLSDKYTYQAKCSMDLRILKPNQRWLNFNLDSKLEVDSVKNSEGTLLPFYKVEKSSTLFFDAGKVLQEHEEATFTVWYKSDDFLSKTLNGWIAMHNEADWFPSYAMKQYATFKLKFTYPEKVDLVSIGNKIEESEADGFKTALWQTTKAEEFASFNLGVFEHLPREEQGLPKITVLKTEKWLGSHRRDIEEEVADDILNAVRFYTHLLGDAPYNHLYVSESPYLHGVAFPGLIHLSTSTYQVYSHKGYDEVFRAHETAHQWWGLGVDEKTYHDKWISEGFSEYFGMWYMQMALRDNDKFFKMLDNYRKDVLNNRKYLLGDGQQSGPIWMGYRNSSSTTRGDYSLVVYEKGAWVLHMLRSMLINLKTMNEDQFMAILKDFYQQYKGGQATTDDFKNVVEKHLQQNMDWFFNQWVYGTEIPHYKWATKVQQLADGRADLKFRILTEGVSDDFRMPVPIELRFGKQGMARISRQVYGKQTEFSVMLPLAPDDVKFNIFDAVLAETEEVRW